tara:strand:- start:345 stop:1037 length:693 start_codon:yes stop_codon:yes gene_type:complete
MKIDIITLFPEMLDGFLNTSIMKRASDNNYVDFHVINPRDFTTDKHKTTDDRPFGGGPGMLMKPEPLFAAVESLKSPFSKVILLSPIGKSFSHNIAKNMALDESHLIFICGHYEGVDERVHEYLADEIISIGDYVLTNGALASAVIIDAVVRLIPDVIGGGEEAINDESFSSGLLDYPQYTRPAKFRNMQVPDVLLSGNHEQILKWRKSEALKKTYNKRSDLLRNQDKKD